MLGTEDFPQDRDRRPRHNFFSTVKPEKEICPPTTAKMSRIQEESFKEQWPDGRGDPVKATTNALCEDECDLHIFCLFA